LRAAGKRTIGGPPPGSAASIRRKRAGGSCIGALPVVAYSRALERRSILPRRSPPCPFPYLVCITWKILPAIVIVPLRFFGFPVYGATE